MSYTETVTGLTKRLLDEADRPVDPHRAIPTVFLAPESPST